MLVAENRPRTLSWLHAGPLLFGDWGTSRLYVLGLAFYYTGHASVAYLGAMSLIMAAVAWAYTIVCRCFPDGGGVYSAARRLNPMLSVIAATLLLCDFIVTAALSAVEGFHYLGMPAGYVVVSSIGAIGVLGVLNWYGARSAGRFALVIAVGAIGVSALIGALCVPLLPEGLRSVRGNVPGLDTGWHKWESLVRIVLALSGVEAVASMTGLMRQPVARTAKRTIWPVLGEVVILNLVFGIALNALPNRVATTVPDYVIYERGMNALGEGGGALKLDSDLVLPAGSPEELRGRVADVKEYRQTAVRVLAEHAGTRLWGARFGDVLGMATGIVFGMLLLSAVNTAILAMVSVFYALARDGELPRALGRLNYSGVPWVGLVLSCVLPAGVLVFVHDDKALGELYAIGVVGAIAINVVCCAWNRELPIARWERAGLWGLGALMVGIEATIVVAKPHATAFAGSVIVVVLGARWYASRRAGVAPVPEPVEGWLAELRAVPAKLEPGRPRIMLAARGRDNAEYAVELARKRGAALFAIYVRTLRVLDVQPGQRPRIEDDREAQQSLGSAAVLARQAGVPFFPIYVTSPSIAEEILDYTVTYGCETLVLGKSKRSFVSRKVAGDVVGEVAEHLPEGVSLVARSGRPDAAPERVE